MSFIQVISFNSDHEDEIRALDAQWNANNDGSHTARRSIVTKDRNDPTRFAVIVFFDSYESAMVNSDLPDTQEFAQKMMALTTNQSFMDLDVVQDTQH